MAWNNTVAAIAGITDVAGAKAMPIANPRGACRGLYALGSAYTAEPYSDPLYGARSPLVDLSGNGNDLTAIPGAIGETFLQGDAGVYAQLPITGDDLAGVGDELSFWCVAKAPANGTHTLMASWDNDFANPGCLLAIVDGAVTAYNFGTNDSTASVALPADASAWCFYGASFSRTGLRIYQRRIGLNGGVARTAFAARAGFACGGAHPITIGSHLGYSSPFGAGEPMVALAGAPRLALRVDEYDDIYEDGRLMAAGAAIPI